MKRSILIPLAYSLCMPFMAIDAMAKNKDVEPYNLPVLTDSMDERVALIKKSTYKGPSKLHYKVGEGYTPAELFELHKELRLEMHGKINTVPSERERDLYHKIMFGKPDRDFEFAKQASDTSEGMRDWKNNKPPNLFHTGHTVNWLLEEYRITKDIRYVDRAVIMADFFMRSHQRLLEDRAEFELWAGNRQWINLGRGYSGISELILEIAKDEKLYDRTAVAGLEKGSSLTYKGRADLWMELIQDLIDFRKKNDVPDNGDEYQNKRYINGEFSWQRDDGVWIPLSTNRFLYYANFLLTAAHAAEELNPKKYDSWIKDQRQVFSEVMAWFQRACKSPDQLRESYRESMVWSEKDNAYMSEFGPYVVWAYGPMDSSTEDYIHLMMDFECFDDILRKEPNALPEPFMKKVATTLMVCTYNYETGGIPYNLSATSKGRNPNSQVPWHRFYAPLYGKYIGRYLPEAAYEKFMDRQLLIWDDLLIKGEIGGSFSQYPMPREIMEARWFRFNKNAVWPVFGL